MTNKQVQQARKDLEMIKVKLMNGGDYNECSKEAQAPLKIINTRAKELAKEFGMKYKELTFAYIMR